jgi:hypothetical protein
MGLSDEAVRAVPPAASRHRQPPAKAAASAGHTGAVGERLFPSLAVEELAMRAFVVCLGALALLWPAWAVADDKDETPAVKIVAAEGITVAVKGGTAQKPVVVHNAKELAKVVTKEDDQKKLQKLVNFRKQDLLVFAWSGSGGDKITYETKKGTKGTEVVFHYKRGLTRDLRRHTQMYAVKKGISWKVQ